MIGIRRVAGLAGLLCAIGACSGKPVDKGTMQAAVDSMTKQRDSTMSRMDSAGVVHSDTARIDTTKRDTTGTTKKP